MDPALYLLVLIVIAFQKWIWLLLRKLGPLLPAAAPLAAPALLLDYFRGLNFSSPSAALSSAAVTVRSVGVSAPPMVAGAWDAARGVPAAMLHGVATVNATLASISSAEWMLMGALAGGVALIALGLFGLRRA